MADVHGGVAGGVFLRSGGAPQEATGGDNVKHGDGGGNDAAELFEFSDDDSESVFECILLRLADEEVVQSGTGVEAFVVNVVGAVVEKDIADFDTNPGSLLHESQWSSSLAASSGPDPLLVAVFSLAIVSQYLRKLWRAFDRRRKSSFRRVRPILYRTRKGTKLRRGLVREKSNLQFTMTCLAVAHNKSRLSSESGLSLSWFRDSTWAIKASFDSGETPTTLSHSSRHVRSLGSMHD